MTAVQFQVEGVPKPQGSKRHVGGGRMIESSKKLPAWRKAVAYTAAAHFTEPLDGPIKLEVEFIMPRTKAMGDKPAPPMIQAPDTDKCVRAINDALSGIAFHDDRQVTTIITGKRRAEPLEQTGARIRVSTDENAGYVL